LSGEIIFICLPTIEFNSSKLISTFPSARTRSDWALLNADLASANSILDAAPELNLSVTVWNWLFKALSVASADFNVDFGARIDQIERSGSVTEEHPGEAPETENYSIDDSTNSFAISLGNDLSDSLSINIGFASVERLPSAIELFMNGPHMATGRFEVGDPTLNSETSENFDITLNYENDGFYAYASFYVNDVPVLFFFTGGHTDYHTPFDDYDKLNYSGMSLIKNLLFELVLNLDNTSKITFQESGPKKQAKIPSRFKVTLGIMPDYVYNKTKGLRIDAVLPDKPAFNGGIKDGDIIIKMGNKPVSDIYEYMHRLSEYSKGDKTEVVVIRNNEQIALEVIF